MPISPETLEAARIPRYYEGKTVLVTGAGGSIGSEVCRKLIEEGVAEIRLLSLTENALYNLRKYLGNLGLINCVMPKLVNLLGSVNDYELVEEATQGADVVIHAAAHKHVGLCEENPVEAIRNNVFGTERMALIAGKRGVKDFVMISTDKAVRPTSVMGATKRLAELCVHDAAKRLTGTRYRIVRFGNVYGSAGSVIPLWKEQIARGGPLTITDPDATRYFMEVHEAVSLVLEVPRLENTDVGPYVFDMGEPKSMRLVAWGLMETLGQVPVKVIGLRPGEKLHEELDYGGERVPTACEKISLIREKTKPPTWRDLHVLLHLVDLRHTAEAKAQLIGLVGESA